MLDLNLWAVLLAAASTLLVGSVWYAPKVFGTRWALLAKVDLENPSNATGAILATTVVSFVTAIVLALATHTAWLAFDVSYLEAALATAVLMWAGFTAARFVTHDAFEGRPVALTFLNVTHELVTDAQDITDLLDSTAGFSGDRTFAYSTTRHFSRSGADLIL
ncbi:DUF1761 domain-containing protein [Agromyces sp. Root81]|uniref:DUF1761 domain-containing protein n=1 Tax=Agromyces sp. Root81 TaxID=1736601 RepID=UPI0009EB88F9|nr:DUF1761 domain-containing protein [Agromyces sp. Root81]